MYVPKHFEETDAAVLHALMRANPLGAWITLADGQLLANHIPFLLDPSRGPLGTLVAHVARANPVWRSFAKDVASVVIFQGAQTYITPSWYPGKAADGKVVPTWNYAVVHAHGLPRAIEDRDWLLQHVAAQTDVREAGQAGSSKLMPWKVAHAPADYIEAMLRGIVGIEIPIDTLVGKWKVSQNRTTPDKQGVIRGLLERGDDPSAEMAALIERHLPSGS